MHHDFVFENASFSLINNKLTFHPGSKHVMLSDKQKKLLICLLIGINEKTDIIGRIWPQDDVKSKNNSYSQLVFQTKLLLRKAGFPEDTLITMPHYGICLNVNFLKPTDSYQDKLGLGDQGIFN